MAILTQDLHTHLYGCLDAEDVWLLGKDRWQHRQQELQWYGSEYKKVFGEEVPYQDFWRNDSQGFELLKQHFEFLEAAPFANFQAKFNLLIALFGEMKIVPKILDYVLTKQKKNSRGLVEHRLVYPGRRITAESELFELLDILAETLRSHGSPKKFANLSYSLSRSGNLAQQEYLSLKKWQTLRPDLSPWIVGIDFCEAEEAHPPSYKQDLFQRIHRDNAQDPEKALAILYHVGESFETMNLASSIRWVWQANAFGAHRLGHALALGIDPASLRTRRSEGSSLPENTVLEDSQERISHLNWLLQEKKMLNDGGYPVHESLISKELQTLQNKSFATQETSKTATPMETDEKIRLLQIAVARSLKSQGVLIECCPTSNFRIGRVPSAEAHPLAFFLKQGLPVIIATDDPGIFATSLQEEEDLLKNKFQLSSSSIKAMNETALNSDCSSLVRPRDDQKNV